MVKKKGGFREGARLGSAGLSFLSPRERGTLRSKSSQHVLLLCDRMTDQGFGGETPGHKDGGREHPGQGLWPVFCQSGV